DCPLVANDQVGVKSASVRLTGPLAVARRTGFLSTVSLAAVPASAPSVAVQGDDLGGWDFVVFGHGVDTPSLPVSNDRPFSSPCTSTRALPTRNRPEVRVIEALPPWLHWSSAPLMTTVAISRPATR